MYNGIGLASVRGTATSGYVQYNAGHVRNSSSWQRTWRNANAGNGNISGRDNTANKLLTDEAIKEGATSLALHEKKRRLEVRLLELRDQMEEEGRMKDADIDKEVEWERKRTLERWAKEEEDRNARLLKQQKQQQPQQGDEIEEWGEEGSIKLITKDGEKESNEIGDAAKNSDVNGNDHLAKNRGSNRQPQRQRRWDNPPPSDRMGPRGNRSQNYYLGSGGGRGGNNAQALEHYQEQRNERLRDAFGISDATHKEGEAFDRELQNAKKLEKQKEKELQEKAARKLHRQRIREERRDAKKSKSGGRGRDDDDDEGKRRRKKRDHKRTRRGRSPSTSSGSESSSSYSLSSSSSRSYSSRSSASYSSSSSYSSVSGKGRDRKFRKSRDRRRRGERSYSSSSSRSRSTNNSSRSGSDVSSRSRSGGSGAKRLAAREAKSRRHNGSDGSLSAGGNSSISPQPRPLSKTKMREDSSSQSSRYGDHDKMSPTREGESSLDHNMSKKSLPQTSEQATDTSPGAPSPSVPPASSHGGHSSNDDNARDDKAMDIMSKEAPHISRRSRWGDRPVSLPREKSPELLAPSALDGEGTATNRNGDRSPSPPRETKQSSQTSRREEKNSASRSSGPALGKMKARRPPSYSRSPSGSCSSSGSSSRSFSSDDSLQSGSISGDRNMRRSRSHSSSPRNNRRTRNQKRKQSSPSRSRSRSDSPPRRREKKGRGRRSPSYSSDSRSRSRSHSDDGKDDHAPHK